MPSRMVRHVKVWKQAVSVILSAEDSSHTPEVRNLLLVLQYMHDVSFLIIKDFLILFFFVHFFFKHGDCVLVAGQQQSGRESEAARQHLLFEAQWSFSWRGFSSLVFEVMWRGKSKLQIIWMCFFLFVFSQPCKKWNQKTSLSAVFPVRWWCLSHVFFQTFPLFWIWKQRWWFFRIYVKPQR